MGRPPKTLPYAALAMDTHAEPEQTRHNTNTAGPPIRQRFGDVGWWYIDWKDPLSGESGRRYFLRRGVLLAEVSLLAREDVFKATDASQFDGFMASFSA